MINLKECCCGCTLRTGTLIILWITLVWDALRVLLYFGKIIYDPSYSYIYGDLPLITIALDIIFLTACAGGMAVSVFGLYGIQKNQADFLNLCYYYYVGYVGYWIIIILTLIIYPSLYYNVTIFSPLHLFSRSIHNVQRYNLLFALMHTFLTVLTFYAALIIRSCKDNMKRNNVSGLDPDMPDPTTLGYRSSL